MLQVLSRPGLRAGSSNGTGDHGVRLARSMAVPPMEWGVTPPTSYPCRTGVVTGLGGAGDHEERMKQCLAAGRRSNATM